MRDKNAIVDAYVSSREGLRTSPVSKADEAVDGFLAAFAKLRSLTGGMQFSSVCDNRGKRWGLRDAKWGSLGARTYLFIEDGTTDSDWGLPYEMAKGRREVFGGITFVLEGNCEAPALFVLSTLKRSDASVVSPSRVELLPMKKAKK